MNYKKKSQTIFEDSRFLHKLTRSIPRTPKKYLSLPSLGKLTQFTYKLIVANPSHSTVYMNNYEVISCFASFVDTGLTHIKQCAADCC